MRTIYSENKHDNIYMKVCSQVLFANQFYNHYLSLENGAYCVLSFGLERLSCALRAKASQYPPKRSSKPPLCISSIEP